jgi:WD40 repeat protein
MQNTPPTTMDCGLSNENVIMGFITDGGNPNIMQFHIPSNSFTPLIGTMGTSVMDLHINADGKSFVAAGNVGPRNNKQGLVGLFDIQTFKPYFINVYFSNPAISATCAPDMQKMAACSREGEIKIIAMNGAVIYDLPYEKKQIPHSLLFSPDSQYLIYGTKKGFIIVHDVNSRMEKHRINLDKKVIEKMVYSPDYLNLIVLTMTDVIVIPLPKILG